MTTIFGKRLFGGVTALFVLYGVSFVAWQLGREREYKREELAATLEQVNERLLDRATSGSTWAAAWQSIREPANLRVTVVDSLGRVTYDSGAPAADLPNHADRKEIRSAWANGQGRDYDRQSAEDGRRYFYVATRFDRLVVRSALPYNDDLREALNIDMGFIYVALATLLLVAAILYTYIQRSSRNILSLRQFARKAARGEHIEPGEAEQFPRDELGYVASRIVQLYKQLQDSTEREARLRKEMTDNIAHELKTPLTAIDGYLQTLAECGDLDEATRREFLARSLRQAERLTALVGDLTTLNRLDQADRPLQRETIDLRDLVVAIREETLPQLAEREMTMIVDLPSPMPLEGDRGLIYSVFRNLTDNAVSYAGRGSTVEVTGVGAGGEWRVEFRDNGVGVDERHLARLFERFYTTDKSRSRQLGGTGLGLAIVKNAVLRHGGTIAVENRRGGGLLFRLTLPR